MNYIMNHLCHFCNKKSYNLNPVQIPQVLDKADPRLNPEEVRYR